MKENPEIKELRDRVSPVERTVSFGTLYVPRRKEIKESLSKKEVIQLILQFFNNEGMKESRQKLEELTKIKRKEIYLIQTSFKSFIF